MKVGDLCRVIKKATHSPCQKDELVLITGKLGSVYFEAFNTSRQASHHYSMDDLEVISEGR